MQTKKDKEVVEMAMEEHKKGKKYSMKSVDLACKMLKK